MYGSESLFQSIKHKCELLYCGYVSDSVRITVGVDGLLELPNDTTARWYEYNESHRFYLPGGEAVQMIAKPGSSFSSTWTVDLNAANVHQNWTIDVFGRCSKESRVILPLVVINSCDCTQHALVLLIL